MRLTSLLSIFTRHELNNLQIIIKIVVTKEDVYQVEYITNNPLVKYEKFCQRD